MILQMLRLRSVGQDDMEEEVHEQVPESWFAWIWFGAFSTAVICCKYFEEQLQLSTWGVLISQVFTFIFTLPIGVIQATKDIVSFLVQIENVIICLCLETLLHLILMS